MSTIGYAAKARSSNILSMDNCINSEGLFFLLHLKYYGKFLGTWSFGFEMIYFK